MQGDLAGAVAQFGEVAAEAEAAHDEIWRWSASRCQGIALAYQGDTGAARAAAEAAIEAAAELGGLARASAYAALAVAALAAGRRCGGARGDARRPGSTSVSLPEEAAMRRVLQCRGRAGGRGSARGPPLGRRGRLDDDRLVPVAGADRRAPAWRSRRVSRSRPNATPTTRSRSPPSIQAYLRHSRHPRVPRRSGRRRRQSPRSGAALRRGTGHPATHRRGPLQDLRRRLRSLGGGAARRDGREGLRLRVGRGRRAVHRGGDRLRPARPRRTQTPHQRLGLTHPHRARRRATGQRRARPTTTSPHGFSSHRAPCKPTSPTSTPNSA